MLPRLPAQCEQLLRRKPAGVQLQKLPRPKQASDGAHRSFGVNVRENEGPVIFKATLSLQAGWQ